MISLKLAASLFAILDLKLCGRTLESVCLYRKAKKIQDHLEIKLVQIKSDLNKLSQNSLIVE